MKDTLPVTPMSATHVGADGVRPYVCCPIPARAAYCQGIPYGLTFSSTSFAERCTSASNSEPH